MMERSKGPKRRATFRPQNKGRKSSSRGRKVRASNQFNQASRTKPDQTGQNQKQARLSISKNENNEASRKHNLKIALQ